MSAPAADGIKVRITQQYKVSNIDGQSVCLHKHGAVGDVVFLSTAFANDLISKGYAVAV